MKFLDAQGRLFGKISILDLGAAAIIALAIVGIFFVPGPSGGPIGAQIGTKPIEVDILVQGLRVRDPQELQKKLQAADSTEIIIRNQPFGKVDLLAAEFYTRTVDVPQADGSVVALSDPRPGEQFTSDWKITVGGDAQITENGAVLGNSKVKIGITVELEGFEYSFRGSIIDVRVSE